MARALEFAVKGQSFKAELTKVDRSALYGSVDVETRDRNGLRCTIATLASDGRTLIPSGGTALGTIAQDGRWLERADLVAVDARGNRLNTVASSFDAPIALEGKTTPERFLDHSIRLAYALDPVEPVPPALAADLDGGAIFKFDFSYRGGTKPDPAFLLKGADSTLWLLVGAENNLNFVGFAQAGGLADTEVAAEAEVDELDFEML